ncbi:2'-5' RNA ligase family protein [Kutzneria viridogrisea]|uniref:Uncharacterized protein n=2 Tax=Kutzneria TaxID=43356 RepID=W5W6E9_9PSEU|nr:2'-5' RNA ligase family protein [Kutzneria albida]AHH93754.1 hypothetical protein KALB_377 [Kutzneria albida DSM 43870]MBA8931242.1 hypothetical protein [Kutzneria viridogrisea]
MPTPGQTAIVLPVPAADPILNAVARSHPHAVRPGISAHVSLLYPWLPVSEVDDAEVSALAEVVGGTPRSVVQFEEVGREPGFVYLSSPGLTTLTDAVRARWPGVAPYGGRFGPNPVAHLSVAMGVTDEEAEQVAATAREHLPLKATLDEVWVVAHEDGWRVAHTFTLR